MRIHAPPIGPWDNWLDDELRAGWKPFDLGGRGYPHYTATTAAGTRVKGHPFFAIPPAKGVVPDAVYGMDASYNSFERARPWFITEVAKPNSGVRLVLSGHIHRKGLFVVYKATEASGAGVAGELLIKLVFEKEVLGVRAPLGARVKIGNESAPVPALYVNTTSLGLAGAYLNTR
jgi:hypothetical protein